MTSLLRGDRNRVRAVRRIAPGPRGLPGLGLTLDLWKDPIQTALDLWRQYGDVVRVPMAWPIFGHIVVHPDHVKYVVQDNNHNYPKVARFYDPLKALVGDGLLTSEGDLWLHQRRMMQPAFHHQRLAELGTIMVETAAEMCERWEVLAERRQSFDVFGEMMRLSLSTVASALFGADVRRQAAEITDAVTIGMDFVIKRITSICPLPLGLPLPRHRRFLSARHVLDSIVYRIIQQRRNSGADTGDLLSMLLHLQDEETGERMSDRQLRDEIITIFLAGHETTAVALSWTWYLLSKYPDCARLLRAELSEVLGGRPPTVQDLPRLKYTAMVLQEAMRLYPPFYGSARMPLADDEIGGYHIQAGRPVFITTFLTHRHPAFWVNPEGFDPERFSAEHSAGRPRYAYFPFLGGPRQCIGNSFAMMEMQLVLATVAQRYRLDLVPGHPIGFRPMITLRPRYGMHMTVSKV